MSKDIIYFAENVCGLKLPKWQKDMLLQLYETYKKGGYFVINVYRHQGKQLLQNILINYELWSKDQRIAELEKQLAEQPKAIVEKIKDRINKDATINRSLGTICFLNDLKKDIDTILKEYNNE